MARLRAALVGATGYGGVQLLQLLEAHPEVDLVAAVSSSQAGKQAREIFPHLETNLVLTDEASLHVASPDVVFAALPHGESSGRAHEWLARGYTVIDLGADFRLRDASLYDVWYGRAHPNPELLSEAANGFPELHLEEIRRARLIACPGCYSTAAVLALTPAAAAGLLNSRQVLIDAKSGVSGAGRTVGLGTHFSEVNESVHAYAVEGHRHLPEIDQELARLGSVAETAVTFVPHLIPMTRGILASCYFRFDGDPMDLRELYTEFYRDQPFVRVLDRQPATKLASGSNFCYIGTAVQREMAIVTSAIDNLTKGAAGQAVECMNIRFGFERTTGLLPPARWP